MSRRKRILLLILALAVLFLFVLLSLKPATRSVFFGPVDIRVTSDTGTLPFSYSVHAAGPSGTITGVNSDQPDITLQGYYSGLALLIDKEDLPGIRYIEIFANKTNVRLDRAMIGKFVLPPNEIQSSGESVSIHIPGSLFRHYTTIGKMMRIWKYELQSRYGLVVFAGFVILLVFAGRKFLKRKHRDEPDAVSLSQHGTKTFMLAFVLFAAAFVVRAPLLDTDYDYSFEADADVMIGETRSFYYFIERPASHDPGKMGAVTYFDAPFMIYALNAQILHLAKPLYQPGGDQMMHDRVLIFATRWTNLLFSCLSVSLLFLCLLFFSPRKNAVFLFLLLIAVPGVQSLAVDFMRMDHFLLFTAIFFIYSCLLILQGKRENLYWLLLGFTAALSVSTKIYTAFFLTFPGLLLVLFYSRKDLKTSNLVYFFLSFLPAMLIFFIRWILYPGAVPGFLANISGFGERWYMFTDPALWYYHINMFAFSPGMATGASGFKSITPLAATIAGNPLSLAGVFYALAALGAFFITLAKQFRKPVPSEIFVIIVFAIYSAGLMSGPVTGRFGILIPVFYSFFMVLFFLPELFPGKLTKRHAVMSDQDISSASERVTKKHNYKSRRVAMFVLMLMVTVLFFALQIREYISMKAVSKARHNAYLDVRIAPREWFADSVQPRSRIMRFTSDRLCYPPVMDMDLDFSPRPLNYLNETLPDTVLLYLPPPTKKELIAATDFLMITDNQWRHHLYLLEILGLRNSFSIGTITQMQAFRDSLARNFPEHPGAFLLARNSGAELLERMWADDSNLGDALFQVFLANTADSSQSAKLCRIAGNIYGMNDYKYGDFLTRSPQNCMLFAWNHFLASLPRHFKCRHYASAGDHYFLKEVKIYIINPDRVIN